jgi:hypothetical protein
VYLRGNFGLKDEGDIVVVCMDVFCVLDYGFLYAWCSFFLYYEDVSRWGWPL